MSYAQHAIVSASDFNTLVGTSVTTTANQLNTVWSTGGSTNGYGQTAVSQVATGQTIAASDWASLVNKTQSIASHQGSSLAAVSAPVSGGTITYLSAIPTNLSTVYSNKLNAAIQGTSAPTVVTRSGSWNNNLTFTFTVTFASGNAARYFFNGGGQLKLTFSHPTGTTIDNSLNALATACGTIVLSAPTSGTASISSLAYNGVTKVGGSGTVSSIATNYGYYAWTTTSTPIFTQLVASAPSGYTNTQINASVRTNGAVGSNGDTGNIVTITVKFAELTSTGLTASSGSTTTLAVVPPETTYLTNSWGTITTNGSVSGF